MDIQKVLMKLNGNPFLSKNNDLLEKYKIFDKDSNSINKRFDSEPVHNEISTD